MRVQPEGCGFNLAFRDVKDKRRLIYLDDPTVFSKHRFDHVAHRRSLIDASNIAFISIRVTEKLAGSHIVSKAKGGVKTNPKRVSAIQQIPIPRTKRGSERKK